MAYEGTKHAHWLHCNCLLFLACCLSQAGLVLGLRILEHRYQSGIVSLAGLRQRQHLPKRSAADVLWVKTPQQQSQPIAASSPHEALTVTSRSVLVKQPVKLPPRVFIVPFVWNKAKYVREASALKPLSNTTSTSNRSQDADLPWTVPQVSSSNNSSSTGQTNVSAGSPPPEHWYNHQVSGVTYSGRILGGSNEQSMNVPNPLSDDNSGSSNTSGCSEYLYPPAVQYPTVYFTIILEQFYSSGKLGSDEEAAYSAAVNAFLAPTSEDIVSNTTILDQSHQGHVLCLPSATILLAGGDALRDFFRNTLDRDPNMIFPTAAWGAVRTTNIVYRAPEKHSEITYYWFASDYGECSALCGGGEQTREVACMDSRGSPAADINCPQPAPATTRSCQTQPCEVSHPTDYTMVFGPWSACNSSCGVGSRTRSATCVSKEGYVGSLSSCGTMIQEVATQTWESCSLSPCPAYIWSYSDWICENPQPCDGGTAHRDASCIQADTQTMVSETLCDPGALDSSTQPCAQRTCTLFFWRTKELADCLPEDPQKPCGRYIQRRRFNCVNMLNGEVVPFISCTMPKPDIGDVECQPTIACVADATGNYVPAAADSQSDQQQTTSGAGNEKPMQAADGSAGALSAAEQPEIAPATASDDAGSVVSATDASSSSTSGASKPLDVAGNFTEHVSMHQLSGIPTESDDSSETDAATAAQAAHEVNTSTLADDGIGPTITDNRTVASLTADVAAISGTDYNSTVPADNGSVAGTSSDTTSASSAGSSSSITIGRADSQVTSLYPPQPANQDSVQQLGPGQVVPGWLFNNPTANLQSVLLCPGGRAVSLDGVCCNGTMLDLRGKCCDGVVDACGLCNGTGKAIDAVGACCSSLLDARGVCCEGFIDECGVCNGQNACLLRAELLGSVHNAAIYLTPQSRAQELLIDTLQGALADAVAVAGGKTVEVQRFTVTLTAYEAPVVVAASANKDLDTFNTSSTVLASQYAADSSLKYPQQGDVDPSSFSSSSTLLGASSSASLDKHPTAGAVDSTVSTQPVYASVNRAMAGTLTTASDSNMTSSTMQQPVQSDTVQEDAEQQPAPASLLQSDGLSSDTANWRAMASDTAQSAVHLSDGIMAGTKRLLQVISQSSTIMQPDASDASTVSSNETMMITVLLATGNQHMGLDSGTFIRALQHIMSTPVPVPASKDTLLVTTIKTAERPTVCGDGICQAGEREAVDNSRSCPGDCGLPFLPCPPYDPSRPTCNGMGVCYHSIGSCTCAAGYAGEDCSMCASGYKYIKGYCVAAAFIAPPRANAVVCVNGVCDRASRDVTGAEQLNSKRLGSHSKAGVIGIGVAAGASVFVAVGAAWVVRRKRQTYLQTKCREQLAQQAQAAQG